MRPILFTLFLSFFILKCSFSQVERSKYDYIDTISVVKQHYQKGLRYIKARRSSIDYSKAISYFKSAAEFGDPQSTRKNSQYFASLAYRNGYGFLII